MTFFAAAQGSSYSLLTYVLAAALLFSFGYARAVWVRAKSDYTKTRDAVKPLRKDMWRAIFKALKLGVIVFVVGFALIAWAVHDAREGNGEPTPTEVSSPSPARK